MISVRFFFLRFPCPEGGLIFLLSFSQGLSRVQSPLERRPRTISTDRPEMESRPYEFFFLFPPLDVLSFYNDHHLLRYIVP